jgi:hypothetical protein
MGLKLMILENSYTSEEVSKTEVVISMQKGKCNETEGQITEPTIPEGEES